MTATITKFTPRPYNKDIDYRDAETALYALVDSLNSDPNGIPSAQMDAIRTLRDVILTWDWQDNEDFSKQYEYDYFTDTYKYLPEKEYSVTIVIRATVNVTARDDEKAEATALELFERNGCSALDIYDSEVTNVEEI